MTQRHATRLRRAAAFIVPALIATVFVAALRGPAASAQEPQLGLPESPRNLQVLPADTSTRDVVGLMRGFTRSLGVRCIHCHLGDDPRDLDTVDFASDARPAKQKARVMMRMVQEINSRHVAQFVDLGSDPGSLLRVECATCHHGQTRPRTLLQVLTESADKGGAAMVIAEYDRLRERYYGGWTYDFSESALLDLAGQLAGAGKTDDAYALIDKNLDLFPESFSSYITRAQLQLAAGEAEQAMATLDACIADLTDPGFCAEAKERFQRQRP